VRSAQIYPDTGLGYHDMVAELVFAKSCIRFACAI